MERKVVVVLLAAKVSVEIRRAQAANAHRR